jgi:hypothetical protein
MTNFPDHRLHLDAKAAATTYSAALEKTRRQHWIDWLEAATEPDIWSANRYLKSTPTDTGLTHIPTLRYTLPNGQEALAETNERKSEALSATLFPPKPPPILPDPSFLGYPDEAAPLPCITREQI